PTPNPKPTPNPTPGWALDLGAGPAVGVLPQAAAALRLSVDIVGRHWAAGAGAMTVLPRQLDLGPDATAVVQLWSGAAFGCFVGRLPKRGSVTFPICGGLHAGAMIGRGRGSSLRTAQGTTAWVAAGLSAKVRWHGARRVGAFAGLEGLAPLRRPSFVVGGFGRVCCQNPVSLLVTAGLSVGRAPRVR
ncbi:MAG: hypothetical protein AAF721_25925, partial [Myxococcota bacterium]